VARFKYPPYWCPVELLYESIKMVDSSSLKSRGFGLIAKKRKKGESPENRVGSDLVSSSNFQLFF
jgi:hypothetical protein